MGSEDTKSDVVAHALCDVEVSIIIPLFNELDNVEPLAQRIREVAPRLADGSCECILVDDGSTDGTRDALKALSRAEPLFRPVYLQGNFGQSAALLTGMRRAHGRYVLTLDGDLQNDPSDLPRVVKLLEEYDCVCGYREKRQDTFVRRMSSRVANAARNAVLHDGLRDTGCGTKGFRRECIAHLVAFNGAHRFFGAVMRAANMRIVECPVSHHPRQYGVSKYGIGNRLGRGLFDLVGVAWLQRRLVFPVVEGDK